MILRPFAFRALAVIPLICFAFPLLGGGADDVSKVKALFKSPTRDYSTGPLWVWNDMLTDQQIRGTLQDLAAQHIKQVWVHPRPGLMTPYLSEEWFRLWDVTLEEAERLDMNVWIYDENSYPSGFAGGLVPEAMPESRGRGLVFEEINKAPPKWSETFLGVYRLTSNSCENVSSRIKAGEVLPDGSYVVASQARSKDEPWHGNRCYVNLLSPGVTEKFIEMTFEPYRRHLGAQFGKRIPGVFTDEPNIKPIHRTLPWSETLEEAFRQRWGYSLLENLPSLSKPVGDWQKVRHNYYQVLNDLFVERWAKPNFEYCEANGLKWTGHYWDHEWPDCTGVPDNMAMYAWHQVPAIDTLMNQYSEHTRAQFGNLRAVRELASVANQMGRNRTLCEAYGAGGWDLRFEDMKRIGDWLTVLGINTMNQHLSYITLRGARKRDHPQSFSYHEPWWNAYHISADYFARLSAALSQGEQVNRILVLEPTTTAWMYQLDDARLGKVGDAFFKLLQALEAAQVEYDIGSEDLIARHGSIVPGSQDPVQAARGQVHVKIDRRAALKIGQRAYSTVVLPPLTDNLNRRTVQLLRELLEASPSGQVLSAAETTPRVDGALSDLASQMENHSSWMKVAVSDLPAMLSQPAYSGDFAIRRAAKDKGILFHQRRILADGELLFLANTSIDSPSAGRIKSPLRGLERWDPYTGDVQGYPFLALEEGFEAEFNLPPSGSLLLFLSKKPLRPVAVKAQEVATISPVAPPEIRRLAPNVLTLDYVDVSAGGEARTNLYFYKANDLAWKKNGMTQNPWDSAVQFKDELISKQFPADSGFAAAYRFTIEGAVPADLAIVLERADLYSITCNGKAVYARADDWWLDKAFGRISIAAVAQVGQNVVRLTTSPFTMFHELEPAYLLGSFSLQPTNAGFVVQPERPLQMGSNTNLLVHASDPDSTMWCTAGIGYERGTATSTNDDRAPAITFDLGRAAQLSEIRVWNYNENNVRDMTSRGVREFRVTGALRDQPAAYDIALGTFALARAMGAPVGPQSLSVKTPPVRFIRFEILSNHNGVSFPAQGDPLDNGFVGLSEVQFLSGEERLDKVKVLRASSEYTYRRRFAASLVDGSGLTLARAGWNLQGMPFYGDAVSYREQFRVSKTPGRYHVSVPNWYGSVAAVKVNGKEAGYIDAPPWERDITRWIRNGNNEVEITVVGTLKNTLGPLHSNPALGGAWPWAFQRAPEEGPPPGVRYSNVAYGLFEPFVLKHSAP